MRSDFMKRRLTKDGTLRSATSRRDFLKQSAFVAGMGVWVATSPRVRALAEQSANERLNIACIGIGGKGDSDSEHASQLANIVAICDVDAKRVGLKAAKEVKNNGSVTRPFEKAKQYSDFRKMFDELGKSIDAVTVSIPDHMHAVAAMTAIKLGKHVYCQKPMTHDVWEARQLRMAAREHKVATQMGNQGTASSKLREGVELIRAGVIGPVKEVHIWTNRPIWPQAPAIMTRPPAEPVPDYLNWDQWLGTAPERPYNKAYHPFKWRGFRDFGTGALGDMGCHTANLPFMALKLEYPTSIEGEAGDVNDETYPSWARVRYEFAEREGMPPVTVNWYEGKKDGVLVHPPEELVQKVLAEYAKVSHESKNEGKKDKKEQKSEKKLQLNNSGSIIVGEKGMLYSPHDYGGAWSLLPADDYRDYKAPAETLPRNAQGGDEGQKMEWVEAIKGGRPAMSNFDYAGLLTEFILLGNIAINNSGKKLAWDGPNLKFPGNPEADKFLRREYRSPWSL
jgi:predicted dehydrogenase